jgi:tRNA-Thr(GGU) m(6)t(6)A37 methyltransferase TsaA
MHITIRPIGVMHSPFVSPEGMPIQAVASTTEGEVEIYEQYSEGLRDLDGFDHVILLYQFHLATKEMLKVKPFLDDQYRGVFATRAPARPNRIGLSVVRLLKVEGNILKVTNVDIVSGTPIIDIKPYIPAFDDRPDGRIGWFAGKLGALGTARADGRMR